MTSTSTTFKLERYEVGGVTYYHMWHEHKCIDLPVDIYYYLLTRPDEDRAWSWQLRVGKAA